MIGRDSAQFSGKAGAAQVFKFIGVELERKAQARCFSQDLAGFCQFENTFFTKNVHKGQFLSRGMRQPPFFGLGQCGFTQPVSIRSSITFVFPGNGVCAHVGGNKFERSNAVEQQDGLKLLELSFQIQPVTGLCFHSGGAVTESAQSPFKRLGNQFFQ